MVQGTLLDLHDLNALLPQRAVGFQIVRCATLFVPLRRTYGTLWTIRQPCCCTMLLLVKKRFLALHPMAYMHAWLGVLLPHHHNFSLLIPSGRLTKGSECTSVPHKINTGISRTRSPTEKKEYCNVWVSKLLRNSVMPIWSTWHLQNRNESSDWHRIKMYLNKVKWRVKLSA
jgi:hypothetical protein